jgi:transposase
MDTINLSPQHFTLLRFVAERTSITAVVMSCQERSDCPLCHQPAGRVQSRYVRHLLDLPWQGVALRLELHTRRFFCDTPDCPRCIFTERFATDIAPYARRTLRLEHWFRLVGLALGGEAGARFLRELGVLTSPDTLLVRLRTLTVPTTRAPRVIGIDEFAFRRGRRFGTLVVDLETHRLLDLLPDCERATVVNWLQEHPSIEIVSRDRAYNYGEAIRQGAPQAQQVADRWHLLANLGERLEEFWRERKALLRTPRQTILDTHPALKNRTPRMQTQSQTEHERCVELYHRVKELQGRGLNQMAIHHFLGMSRPTVRRYMQMHQPPEMRRSPDDTPRYITPFVPYILQRWNDGCRNATQLWRELREQGFTQSPRTVSRYLTLLRHESGVPWKFKTREPEPIYEPTAPPPLALTPRQAARLFQRRPDKLTKRERQQVREWCAKDASVTQTYVHVQAFCEMLRTRSGHYLIDWLAAIKQHGCEQLRAFARQLQKDRAAVEAGLTLVWSQGAVEGSVTRLKLIKRSGYGRMGFATLRQRVLIHHAS